MRIMEINSCCAKTSGGNIAFHRVQNGVRVCRAGYGDLILLGGTQTEHAVKPGAIISRVESLQILKNDLRKLALEKHAVELNEASPERREAIRAQIERDIQKEVLRRAQRPDINSLLH